MGDEWIHCTEQSITHLSTYKITWWVAYGTSNILSRAVGGIPNCVSHAGNKKGKTRSSLQLCEKHQPCLSWWVRATIWNTGRLPWLSAWQTALVLDCCKACQSSLPNIYWMRILPFPSLSLGLNLFDTDCLSVSSPFSPGTPERHQTGVSERKSDRSMPTWKPSTASIALTVPLT